MAIIIGKPNKMLERLLQLYHTDEWAIITADNPGSELLTPAENRIRYESLLMEAKRLPFPFFPGYGLDPTGEWPPERNVLLAGISREEAMELGKKFDQNAVVFSGRIIWLIPPESS